MNRRYPLWVVSLQREKQYVREHVVADTANDAMRAALVEHAGYEVVRVSRVTRIGTGAVDYLLVPA